MIPRLLAATAGINNVWAARIVPAALDLAFPVRPRPRHLESKSVVSLIAHPYSGCYS
jgi:hypothetical protein